MTTKTVKTLADFRNDPVTGRTGEKWTDQENLDLIEKIKNNVTYDQIALEHQRTANAIKSHIIDLFVRKIKKHEITVEEASSITKISPEMLIKHTTKTEKKPPPKPVPTGTSDKYLQVLTDIRDYLKILTENKTK